MRRFALVMLLGLLLASTCLAQEQPASPRALCLARMLDIILDMQMLGTVAQLELTTQQLQALAAVYAQYPRPVPDLAVAEKALDQLAQVRAKMIEGRFDAINAGEQEAAGKAFQTAFGEFGPRQPPDGKPVELTVEEKLVWAILTANQKSKLLGGGDGGNQAAAQKALQTIGELRHRDAEAWTAGRDKLAACLSASAGPEGSPARDNARQMFLEYLNRVRALPETDFANQQKELVAGLLALLPPGTSLAESLAEFDPSAIHDILSMGLLGPRAPGIVQEMLAARTKKPE